MTMVLPRQASTPKCLVWFGLVMVLSLLLHLDISSSLSREEGSLSRLLLCLRNEPCSRNHRIEVWKAPPSSLRLESSLSFSCDDIFSAV